MKRKSNTMHNKLQKRLNLLEMEHDIRFVSWSVPVYYLGTQRLYSDSTYLDIYI